MTHRINITEAVEQFISDLLDDPDECDTEAQRDDFLAVIYAWHDEQEG